MASDSTTSFYEVPIKDQQNDDIYDDVASVSTTSEPSIQPMGITESTRKTGKFTDLQRLTTDKNFKKKIPYISLPLTLVLPRGSL